MGYACKLLILSLLFALTMTQQSSGEEAGPP